MDDFSRPAWSPPPRHTEPEPAASQTTPADDPPVFPTLPRTRPAAAPRSSGPGLVLVASLSALVGGLLAGGLVLAARPAEEPRAAATSVPAVIAPTLAPEAVATEPAATEPVDAAPEPAVAGVDPEAASAAPPVDRVAQVAAAVLPSVVQIDIDTDAGDDLFTDGNGSGVVYRSDGLVLTNNHVVADAVDVTVVFSDGSREVAEVVGTDPLSDLAVIRVPRQGLPAVAVADPDELQIGELAVAVGSPFGLEGSVTAGVVSALSRRIEVDGPDGPVSLYNSIQTDAPINPGNSGGPLVDGQGRLIGINSAILTAGATAGNAGVGFAIPVSIAVEVAEELIAGGAVRYPFLGVRGQDVTPQIAARVGVEQGALIEDVEPGTPADDAGLAADDVVIAIDGEPVASMDDLVLAIRRAEVGETVVLRYRRGGVERETEVVLTDRPSG